MSPCAGGTSSRRPAPRRCWRAHAAARRPCTTSMATTSARARRSPDRLYQGPFPTEQFAGWQVVMATTARPKSSVASAWGLVTYLCDEVGPAAKPGETPGEIAGRPGAAAARHQALPARELEGRAAQARQAGSVRALAARVRPREALRQAPGAARDDEQPGHRRHGAAGVPRRARADGRARRMAEPAALRAALRRPALSIRLRRAGRPAGAGIRRPSAGRVRRYRDVRLLGRGPHVAARTQSFSRLCDCRSHLRADARAAARALEENAARDQHAARLQQGRKLRAARAHRAQPQLAAHRHDLHRERADRGLEQPARVDGRDRGSADVGRLAGEPASAAKASL